MSETALPARSAVTMAIVSPAGVAASSGADARRRAIRPASDRRRSGASNSSAAHPHGPGIGQVPVAVREGELGRLDEDVHVVGLRQRGHVERLGHAEHRQRRHPLGRRRKARRHATAIADREWRHPLRPMLGEVLDRERAAGGGGGGHDPPRHVAAIERLGPARRHRFERSRQVGLDEGCAAEDVGVVEGPEISPDRGRGLGAEEIRLPRRRCPLAVGGREALARIGDRVRQELAPTQRRAHGRAAVLVGRPPTVHRARHGERGHASARGNRGVDTARSVPLDRRGPCRSAAVRGGPAARRALHRGSARHCRRRARSCADRRRRWWPPRRSPHRARCRPRAAPPRPRPTRADAATPPCRAARAPRSSGWGSSLDSRYAQPGTVPQVMHGTRPPRASRVFPHARDSTRSRSAGRGTCAPAAPSTLPSQRRHGMSGADIAWSETSSQLRRPKADPPTSWRCCRSPRAWG